MKRLEDKVAIITGATGGIGRAAVELFIKEGANVVMVDLNEEALIEVSNKINSNKLSYFQGDVSILADNKRAVELAIERHGGLDVFIANAGVAGDVQPITEYDEETFDKVMAVNAKGPFLGLKAAIPHMSERGGGSFVVTSSVAGVTGASLLSPYVMSKHAVVGLIKSAAKECADMNIRVNSVNPSPVETNMMRVLEDGMNDINEEDNPKTQIEQTIPLKRYAEPIEIANLLLFLSGDESEFITGSVHMIDGGFTA
jgi:NAD(P)-dependent dehydrogenase (short-subunit alcohol dehydrogenase family)